MTNLHNNYKDVFRAFRLGFSIKKISMMMLGYLIAIIGYNICSYLAFLAQGWSFAEIWATYRLLPIPETLHWSGWLLWAIGIAFGICVLLITGTAVCKVTFEQLKGDDFFEIKKAFKYALKNGRAIIMSPVMVILFILSVVVAGLILSLIGRIPYFGEIFTGLMILLAFAASLFIVYLLIILKLTLMYSPAIIAASGNDTFDTLFEVFSMLNDQTARLIWYSVILSFLSKIGLFIMAFFSALAVKIGTNILAIFMGNKLNDILLNAASTFKLSIPYWCPEPIARLVDTVLGGTIFFSPPSYQYINIANLIASILFAIGYYLLIIFVISYGTTVWFTGTLTNYLVIVKKKDDRNLLETKEEPATQVEEKTATSTQTS
ncbi:MAG: hypothetical protein N2201_04345 [candidate division WOR-3 bacterium]|nr:hypothetical protein [candidate division WOR-3 bacterium]